MASKAKAKAKELVEKFMIPIDELHIYPMCFDTAKQCASIAVELILSTDLYSEDADFWINVYEQIKYYEKR
jgi:hypothetical protein